MKKILGLLSFGFLALITTKGYAQTNQVKLCNQSEQKAFISYGVLTNQNWKTWGWQQVDPGECKDAFATTTISSNGYLYITNNQGQTLTPVSQGLDTQEVSLCIKKSPFQLPNAQRTCNESEKEVIFRRYNTIDNSKLILE